MKIIARCHPLLEPLLPKPILAKHSLPSWLKSMPSETLSATLGGESIRTLKHCPPIIDAMTAGLLILLPTDIHIKNGEISWDWSPPIISDASITRSPIGVHVREQAYAAPFQPDDSLIVKFINFWTLEAPSGYSLLFTHPVNRTDLPFLTLSGIVDCDEFKDGYVHFPAIIDQDFEGTIPQGAPIAQVFPILREKLILETGNMDIQHISRNRELQSELASERGIYRKRYRKNSE